MTKYQTLHKRKVRRKLSRKKEFALSEEELLKKARHLYEVMKRKKIVRETAARMKNISIRIDLTGAPEVSFVIAVMNGKINFIKDDIDTDMAVGMDKEFFIKLVEDPPKYGNMKTILFNNIFLRKGRIQLFRYFKPIFVNALVARK